MSTQMATFLVIALFTRIAIDVARALWRSLGESTVAEEQARAQRNASQERWFNALRAKEVQS